MDTLEFFRAILPEDGIHYLALFKPEFKAPAHKAYTSLEEMAKAVEGIDRGDWQVYHACGSYNEEFVLVGEKKKYRVEQNWAKAKAFWVDLDCGQEKFDKGDGYLTKRDAATAMKEFCEKVGLPKPFYVDSGNGIHAYWPLTKAIPAATWVKLATVLKAALAFHEVKADPSRTSDFASILRPVGAHNKKTSELKPVVAKNTVNPIEPQEFANVIKQIAQTLPKQEAPKAAVISNINDDLSGGLDYSNHMESSAELAATKCAQIAEMRDTKGDVSYEHWRGVIGIIKHSVEGFPLAEEWSSEREATGHSQLDVDIKYDTWDAGPTTCQFFSIHNPAGCENCPSKGKVKSPIVLGRISTQQESVVVEAIVDGETMEVQVPEFPKRYKHVNNTLIREMEDKDGIMHEFMFSPNLFYPLYRIRKEDGTYSLRMRHHLPNNRTREFELETQALAAPQKLADALSKYEVLGSNNKDSNMHMTAYMRDFLEKLKTEADEMNTMTTYGWTDDSSGFLLGDRFYHKDGTMRKVFVGGMAKTFLDSFPVRGTVEGYAKAVDFLYNREGMEPMQYIIGNAFGSILTPFADSQYKGLILSVAGGESGKGKTTVCMAGLYAFGNAQEMQIGGKTGATMNGRYGMLATYKNVPILMDELTHMPNEAVAELAFQLAMGKEKIRQQVKSGSGSVGMADIRTFALATYTTSNEGLHGKLASFQDNSQAEAVRIIEIKIDNYPATKLDSAEVDPIRQIIERNVGAAGDAFLKYVVQNLDSVIAEMAVMGKKLHADIPESELRFWRWHATCTLVGLKIAKQLGIVSFDINKLYDFTVSMFKTMNSTVKAQNTLSPEDALNNIISQLNGQVIVTNEYRHAKDARGPEYVSNIRGEPIARFINGSANMKTDTHDMAGKLYICRKAFVAACKGIRVEPEAIIEYAKSIGIYVPTEKKFTIGKGTNIKTGNSLVYCFNQAKLEELDTDAPRLTAYIGGKNITGAVANE